MGVTYLGMVEATSWTRWGRTGVGWCWCRWEFVWKSIFVMLWGCCWLHWRLCRVKVYNSILTMSKNLEHVLINRFCYSKGDGKIAVYGTNFCFTFTHGLTKSFGIKKNKLISSQSRPNIKYDRKTDGLMARQIPFLPGNTLKTSFKKLLAKYTLATLEVWL